MKPISTHGDAVTLAGELERARDVLRAQAPELRRLGVVHLALFGSLARGDAQLGSDVDVVINVGPDKNFSLWALGEARVRLSQILGRNVDLLIDADILPELRRRIARDLRPVF